MARSARNGSPKAMSVARTLEALHMERGSDMCRIKYRRHMSTASTDSNNVTEPHTHVHTHSTAYHTVGQVTHHSTHHRALHTENNYIPVPPHVLYIQH